jgi:aspartate racemase
MRTIGMIGGLGPESTIDYYRSIIARYRARRPDGGYPHVVINSLDVDTGLAMLDAGRLDELANYLADGLELLVRAGAETNARPAPSSIESFGHHATTSGLSAKTHLHANACCL